jgi:hypothetical protein
VMWVAVRVVEHVGQCSYVRTCIDDHRTRCPTLLIALIPPSPSCLPPRLERIRATINGAHGPASAAEPQATHRQVSRS